MVGHLFLGENMEVKQPTTYEEQIEILKRRGMIIPDENRAIQFLKSESYYRISGYWLTMLIRSKEEGSEDHFCDGASFDDVMDLYCFDQDLRMVVLYATSRIETNIKAYISYFHSHQYGPLGYLDKKNFEDAAYFFIMKEALWKDIQRQKSSLFVKHHINNKNNVFPVWVATELLTFDQISKFYKNMLPKDRSYIAKEHYHIPSREYIENWLSCSVVARNIAAHGGRFYNRYNFGPTAKLPKTYLSYSKSFFGIAYCISHLLQFSDREVFKSGIDLCFKEHPSAMLKHLGFPENWKTIL